MTPSDDLREKAEKIVEIYLKEENLRRMAGVLEEEIAQALQEVREERNKAWPRALARLEKDYRRVLNIKIYELKETIDDRDKWLAKAVRLEEILTKIHEGCAEQNESEGGKGHCHCSCEEAKRRGKNE